MIRTGGRLRVVLSVLAAVVLSMLVFAGCSAQQADSGTPASSTTVKTSVAATATVSPTSLSVAQPNPGAQAQDGVRPRPADNRPPAPGGTDNCGVIVCGAQPGGTDNCGIIVCGENPPPAPGGTDNCGVIYCGAVCTDRFDYTGDPRSKDEINALAQPDGKCPEPIRPVTTSPAPPVTTSVAPTSAATTSPAPAVTTSPAAK
ncbi:hypothetical protein [Nocardia vulneris]|uniref:hypothetical protein n=1 Tax=Nocardia vulneris TaxID=1141657 RepID=UPI000A499E71|nr:hypothetical protein [Nocardia vulneris]